MERRLSAMLAADVVGYSGHMEHEEAATFDRPRKRRTEVFEPEIASHHGRVFKLMGDGLLAEFGSVVDAVERDARSQSRLGRQHWFAEEAPTVLAISAIS